MWFLLSPFWLVHHSTVGTLAKLIKGREGESKMELSYNYDKFILGKNSDDPYTTGIELGEKFPMGTLLFDKEGARFDLRSLYGKKFVLETGSLSCPHYLANIGQMNRINEYFDNIEFLVVYVREEHPGNFLTQHQTTKEKIERAKLLTSKEEFRRTFSDGKNGGFHRKLGGYPNMLYVVDEKGVVKFKRFWNQPGEVHIHLSGLLLSETRDAPSPFPPESPGKIAVVKTLLKAGPRALMNYAISLPRIQVKRRELNEFPRKPIENQVNQRDQS
jgi:hypothetical protein